MLSARKFGAAATAGAAAALLATAGSAAARQVSRDSHHGRVVGANVFVQTDNPAGNAIAVYDRGLDGTLTAAGTYSTGGDGGMLVGSVVDHLGSQGSLQYDASAGELFAVNAGSDSVSVFEVRGDELHLRQVVGSGGSFPVSVAVHGDVAYVLNALDGGSIQGYRLVNGGLVPIPGSKRLIGLNQTLTPQFVNTPGDVAFSPDGQQLLVTTKANTNAIDVFAIGTSGLPSALPVVNDEPGDVPFALAFTGPDRVNVGEAGTNAVGSFRLSGNGTLTAIDSVATGGAATCWVIADGAVLFAGNAGSATESSVWSSPSGTLSLVATTNTDPGTIDAATSPDGHLLYVQTGGNGIVDEFRVGDLGSLTEIGSVTVPNAIGGQGIATS
jgi:6-phosphogluconolactonase (cycloisomerase 2 family)